MLTMQAAEKSVRSRTPSSRRSFGVFVAARLGGVEAIWEIVILLPGLISGLGRDYIVNVSGTQHLRSLRSCGGSASMVAVLQKQEQTTTKYRGPSLRSG